MTKFSDWLEMALGTATIRIRIFISIQESWVGKQNPEHKYEYHIWYAALRPAPAGIRGKELIFWGNDWERTKARLLQEEKRMIVAYALIGRQKKLYYHLIKKRQR